MITRNYVRENAYYDSVTLMMISSKISAVEGVQNAAVMMGTDYNKRLMRDSGLLMDEHMDASANAMIIGVIASSEALCEEVLEMVNHELERKSGGSGKDELRAKTISGALRQLPRANFAVISIPGRHAAREVDKALDAGLNVLLFSDNVSIEDEVRLKDKAIDRGLLMMGADCGTAIINGVPLGFANRVRKGRVGIVAASGTGLQEVSVIVHRGGEGVSQAIGTGGRDLKDAVDGRMMRMGLEALMEDPQTEVILLVSKPPSEVVMKKILETAGRTEKPVIGCFLGGDPKILEGSSVQYAETLEDAALMGLEALGHQVERNAPLDSELVSSIKRRIGEKRKYLRGLYSGGTLTYEALWLMQPFLDELRSNLSMKGVLSLEDVEVSVGHTLLDLGDDYFTDGRPHPMIDPRSRVARLEKELDDPETAVVLLDVVIGFASHEDPAGALVPLLERVKARGDGPVVIASVCGVEEDPQVLSEQIDKLKSAGVYVMETNAMATRLALAAIGGGE